MPETINFIATDDDIEKKDSLSLDLSVEGTPELASDVLIVDNTTESFSTFEISKVGKDDGEVDRFTFDLSTFDDDFSITIKSEESQDQIILNDASSVTDNGDGTFTVTFIGEDNALHTIEVDPGDAQLIVNVSDGVVDGTDAAEDMGPGFSDTGGDVIDGADGLDDTILGNAGDDTIDAGLGNDSVDGGLDNDAITGGAGNDTLFGNIGNDTLDGGTGADSLLGDTGDDIFRVDQGDTAEGGAGDDIFNLQDLDTTGTGNAPITIIGGEAGETNGDTLVLTSDVSQNDISFTNTDDDGGGLSGSFTLSDGTLVTFSEIENIVCFTPGTTILTAQGERPVETLQPGDMVLTRDHGLQPIRWVGQRRVRGTGRLAPIRIAQHVLPNAQADLLVSPQHRVLLTGYHAELLFGESEVLAAAKHLINDKDVRREEVEDVTYVHFMFDAHEVVYSNGAPTESFHAGDVGLMAIGEASREELFSIFPELRSWAGGHGTSARQSLKRYEAELMAERLFAA